MAAPVVESHTVKGYAVPVTSLTINKPSGVVSGDLLLVAMYVPSDNVFTVTGWTPIYAPHSSSGSLTVACKVAGGSEPSDYTFAMSTSVQPVAILHRISGIDSVSPINVSSGATATYTAPSATSTVDDGLIILVGGGSSVTAVPGTTTQIASDGFFDRLRTAQKAHPTAGATGTHSFSGLNSPSAGVLTMVIAPPGGGGGGGSISALVGYGGGLVGPRRGLAA